MNPTRAITAAALTLVNAWLLMLCLGGIHDSWPDTAPALDYRTSLLLVIAARCLRQPTLAKQGDAR